MRSLQLHSLSNARDLGKLPTTDNSWIIGGLFYRGPALSGASAEDCERLFGALGVRHVIDLRCGWERREFPDIPWSGVTNTHIPFFDKEIVGIEYTEPTAGTRVVGRDVACHPAHFYHELSNPLTARQMRHALDQVFSLAVQGQAVYYHCSGGKDRAGVLSALIELILGVRPEAILEDYLFTNVSRDKQYDELFARFMRLSGGDAERANELVLSHRALPENLEAFAAGVTERYGSMAVFLDDVLGFPPSRCEALRKRLTSDRAEIVDNAETCEDAA